MPPRRGCCRRRIKLPRRRQAGRQMSASYLMPPGRGNWRRLRPVRTRIDSSPAQCTEGISVSCVGRLTAQATVATQGWCRLVPSIPVTVSFARPSALPKLQSHLVVASSGEVCRERKCAPSPSFVTSSLPSAGRPSTPSSDQLLTCFWPAGTLWYLAWNSCLVTK